MLSHENPVFFFFIFKMQFEEETLLKADFANSHLKKDASRSHKCYYNTDEYIISDLEVFHICDALLQNRKQVTIWAK